MFALHRPACVLDHGCIPGRHAEYHNLMELWQTTGNTFSRTPVAVCPFWLGYDTGLCLRRIITLGKAIYRPGMAVPKPRRRNDVRIRGVIKRAREGKEIARSEHERAS